MLPLALFLIFGSSFWNRNSSSSKDVVTGYMTFPCAAGTRHCRFCRFHALRVWKTSVNLKPRSWPRSSNPEASAWRKNKPLKPTARNLSFEKLHREVPSKLRWIYNFIDCFIVFCWLCFIVLYLEKTHAQFLQQIHTRWQRKATKSQACLVE